MKIECFPNKIRFQPNGQKPSVLLLCIRPCRAVFCCKHPLHRCHARPNCSFFGHCKENWAWVPFPPNVLLPLNRLEKRSQCLLFVTAAKKENFSFSSFPCRNLHGYFTLLVLLLQGKTIQIWCNKFHLPPLFPNQASKNIQKTSKTDLNRDLRYTFFTKIQNEIICLLL